MSRVAIRYSKALFELALEEQIMEEVRSDLEMIKDVCAGNTEFQNALNNPLIEERVKANLLKKLFEDKLNPLTFKFLQLLSKKKRSGFLLEMIYRYMERVLEHNDILSASLITAGQMERTHVDTIKNRVEDMTGKSVILSEQIDDTLVGGFIVKIKDTVIDLSIRTQLEKLRTQLVRG